MDEIKGIARVKFHPGKVEEWKRLSEEAMEIVRTRDSGTLQYEIFFNEDETEAVVFERYRDADAAITCGSSPLSQSRYTVALHTPSCSATSATLRSRSRPPQRTRRSAGVGATLARCRVFGAGGAPCPRPPPLGRHRARLWRRTPVQNGYQNFW